jgi:hypothetical protein
LDRIAREWLCASRFASVDGKEICQFLDIYPGIRRSYPQLLGLADLDLILNRDLYTRSRAFVEQWQPRLATYVQTEAHRKSIAVLKKNPLRRSGWAARSREEHHRCSSCAMPRG